MKLPYAEQAVVEREKITDYLLNPAHPDNSGKAPFFVSLGFRPDDWPALAAALCKLAVATEVAKSMVTTHGVKYVLDGRMETPGGEMHDRAPDLDCGLWMGQTAPDHGLSARRMRGNYDKRT
jgi:hypothetical protein